MKIAQIGPYPPPNSGWSVRIRYLCEEFKNTGIDYQVLNLGKNRKIKSPNYLDVQNGLDYLKKLVTLRLHGYHFHIHTNAQAVKGPILSLIALVVSLLTMEKAVITFHGGINQLYFPKKAGKRMYPIIYLNFLLAKVIICNNKQIKKEILRYGFFISESKIRPIAAFSQQYLSYKKTGLPKSIENYIKTKKYTIACYIVLRNGFFIETLIEYLKKSPPDIGTILIGIREIEDQEVSNSFVNIKKLQEEGTVLNIANLDHDQFMSLLNKCDLYLRTPISDGVTSSVLEALSLKVPVVASENGRRPKSVITYCADDVNDLERKIHYSLENLNSLRSNIIEPDVSDTVSIEVDLLRATFS